MIKKRLKKPVQRHVVIQTIRNLKQLRKLLDKEIEMLEMETF